MMEMASRTKKFHFVNKSEASIHLSNNLPSEKAIIQRHVQTGRKRGRDAKGKKKTNNNASMIEEQLPISTSHPSVNHNRQLEEAEEDSQPRSGAHAHEGKAFAISLEVQKILYKKDPFNATSVPIDKAVAGLLHYYVYFYHPSQWPNEMALLRQGMYVFQSTVVNVMKTAVADKLLMYCLLSAAACRLQFVDRLPSPSVAGKENHYIQKALPLIASYINTHDLQQHNHLKHFLICLLFINSAEAYRGDFSAAKMHFTALVRLLQPIGGLKAVEDKSLRGQLAMADLFISCINFEPCALDCPYDPGAAEILELTSNDFDESVTLGTASSLLNSVDTLITSELGKLVEELLESHSIKSRVLTSSMQATRAMQVTHWISLRNMAIRHRLLAFQTKDSRLQCLRTAIVMWTLLTMNVTGRAKTVKVMAPKLQYNLSTIPSLSWVKHENIKLWIVLVGLYCANEDSRESMWFLDQCRCLQDQYHISSSQATDVIVLARELENFQLTFFFDVPVQRPRTHAIARRLAPILGRVATVGHEK